MSRLIVLSNRVMLPSLSNKESAGGLGVAIEETLKKVVEFGLVGAEKYLKKKK